MIHRITTFAATATLLASVLTGCASELDVPDNDRIACAECLDAADGADVPVADASATAIPDHPTVADLSMTTIHAELFRGDWPVEEIVVQAYTGGLDEGDRAMIEAMVGGEARGVDFALAKLALKIDEGGVLTADELDLVEEIEDKLDEILHPWG